MFSLNYSSFFTIFGFCLVFLVNTFFIVITVFRIKKLQGTYKQIVITFACLGISFAGLEIIARPFAHNYKNQFLYFSLNEWMESKIVLRFLLASWAGFYVVIVWFVAIQFVYRYLCIFDGVTLKKFDGKYKIVLISFPFLPGCLYVFLLHFLCAYDKYADDYMKDIVLQSYQLPITQVQRFNILPYQEDGSLRWENLGLLLYGLVITLSGYLVILYCGIKMRLNRKKELSKRSAAHQELEAQFFKALIAQSLGPTIFLVLPVAPILASPLIPPFFGFNVNWQTGWFFCILGFYSPFDSIAFMFILKEYRTLIKKQYSKMVKCGNHPGNIINVHPWNNTNTAT
ncbi:Seven TM Receptor [Caenorhabditis elegans]|uniref:Seven TM Receptor n=1 Tax=Caenorhabditis elegans TaxID=6239 RepID=Q9XU38_CAEEL|nr:Seven TM Receptor [Caenorhabditis elegans]CAB07184.2 Seven TM Receptor [Caenorhabditis elegans]|eukprot:NP_001343590.1 Seven TM Receptor [Caenorhabditis elegans]